MRRSTGVAVATGCIATAMLACDGGGSGAAWLIPTYVPPMPVEDAAVPYYPYVPDGGSCTVPEQEVLQILGQSCASCHARGGYTGTALNDILDTSALVSQTSPDYSSADGGPARYLVPGDPDDSLVYQLAVVGSMPPSQDVVDQELGPAMAPSIVYPSADDLLVLRSWITSCLGPVQAPDASPVLDATDAVLPSSGGDAAAVLPAQGDDAGADGGSTGSPTDAMAGIDTAPDAGSDGFGGYFTVSGSSPLAGVYAFSNSGCGGSGLYYLSAGGSAGTIAVEVVGVTLDAGETATSPKVKVVLTLGTVDDGTYPVGSVGSCSATDEGGGWPCGDVHFSCTNLVGIGSGDPFGVSGYINVLIP